MSPREKVSHLQNQLSHKAKLLTVLVGIKLGQPSMFMTASYFRADKHLIIHCLHFCSHVLGFEMVQKASKLFKCSTI